ncbi:hypothetical protein [Sandaracinobacteroides hominis]|uniref:hypothetical protein n=1 Tax=Sandaracinobacteroides hominis TaxID=2780086 RepID=UPI0018F6B4F6|nr:hypothetical protein [Sandaracinobacteroides hominis]
MSDNKMRTARQMANKLFATEQAIDEAFRNAAELAAFMPVARLETNVSAAVGQEAIEQVVATMSMLSRARRRAISVHGSLAETQEKIGLRPHNFGGFVDKPSHAAIVKAVETAQRVAA